MTTTIDLNEEKLQAFLERAFADAWRYVADIDHMDVRPQALLGMPAVIVEEKLAAIKYLTGAVPSIPEGSLLPDSYGYKRGEARAAVVKRMQAAMAKTLPSLPGNPHSRSGSPSPSASCASPTRRVPANAPAT